MKEEHGAARHFLAAVCVMTLAACQPSDDSPTMSMQSQAEETSKSHMSSSHLEELRDIHDLISRDQLRTMQSPSSVVDAISVKNSLFSEYLSQGRLHNSSAASLEASLPFLSAAELRDVTHRLADRQPLLAVVYFTKAFEMAQDETLKTKLLFDICFALHRLNQHEKKRQVLEKIIERCEGGTNPEYLGNAYYHLARATKDDEKVEALFLKAADAYLANHRRSGAALCWLRLGDYFMKSDTEKSMQYFQKIIDNADQIDDTKLSLARKKIKKAREQLKPYNKQSNQIFKMLTSGIAQTSEGMVKVCGKMEEYIEKYPDSTHSRTFQKLLRIAEDAEEETARSSPHGHKQR